VVRRLTGLTGPTMTVVGVALARRNGGRRTGRGLSPLGFLSLWEPRFGFCTLEGQSSLPLWLGGGPGPRRVRSADRNRGRH